MDMDMYMYMLLDMDMDMYLRGSTSAFRFISPDDLACPLLAPA